MLEKTTVVVPSGDGVGDSFTIELESIGQAESRMVELTSLTPLKGAELAQFFLKAADVVAKVYARTFYEKDLAENRLKEVISDARFNLTDEKIKEAGFAKASKDLRDAFVDRDEAVKKARNNLSMLKALCIFLDEKKKTFNNAHYAAKKFSQDDTQVNTNSPGNRDVYSRERNVVLKEDDKGTPASDWMNSMFGTPKIK